MIKDRFVEVDDLPLLALSLAKDEYHKSTEPEFFTQPGTVAKIYDDEKGPVLFLRGAKALRLDVQFVDNNDFKRNAAVMLEGFPALVKQAREHGFTEVVFNTSSPLLKRFCMRRLGFEEVEGDELRKFL